MPRPSKPRNGQTILPEMVKYAPRPSRAPGYKRQTPEANEQAALIRWARLWASHGTHGIPILSVLHASLNGVRLTPAQASKAKAGGMVAGVWDLFIPAVRNHGEQRYGGLWIEMKSSRGRLTPEQWAFQGAVGENYHWEVCRTWHEAAGAILAYLGTPATHPAWEGLEK